MAVSLPAEAAMRTSVGSFLVVMLLAAAPSLAGAQTTAPTRAELQQSFRQAGKQASQARKLDIANTPWTGDFDRMLERHVIRVVVPYSRSLYFTDRGNERGLSAELARDFERWVNERYRKQLGKRPLTVYIFPVTRDKLLPDVAGGLADMALGNLTVTEERLKTVEMIAPRDLPDVHEIVVTGPGSAPVASVDDLAGRVIHVRRSSSYYESLVAQNERFKSAGKKEIRLVVVPDALEDEDMMEMTNGGLLEAIVVDDWKTRMWAPVLPKLRMHSDVVLRGDGRTGWVIRKGSPKLAGVVNDFYANWAKKQGVIPYRMQQYMKRINELKDPTGSGEWKRFRDTLVLFEKYGKKYDFDPLMLAAQGFQESRIDQSKRSPAGAIGVMQIMPATGAHLDVGNIQLIEPNINAGAKYMDQLMTKYFPDAEFSEGNRPLFAFASYNAGPGSIAKARAEAQKRGLDPDTWFNNVEIVVGEKIGMETTTYVRNIYKYYVAYRLILDAQAEAENARERVAPKS
jgi:membrane-bound lytic murein transglycosylase MltF